MFCYNCGSKNNDEAKFCYNCGTKLVGEPAIPSESVEKKEFNGIYKFGMFGEKIEVYCPKCKSSNCSHYSEEIVIPGKTKTRYTANLNPLKPFTLVNKKEKQVKKDKVKATPMIRCNDCGKTWKA